MVKNDRIIKLSCDVEGYEDDWIEIDTSAWTPGDFLVMIDGVSFPDALQYLRDCAVDWHLTGDNGLVKFPGVTADDAAWDNAFRRLGPGGLGLMRWLCQTPSEALIVAIDLPSKSASVNDGAGNGKA